MAVYWWCSGNRTIEKRLSLGTWGRITEEATTSLIALTGNTATQPSTTEALTLTEKLVKEHSHREEWQA